MFRRSTLALITRPLTLLISLALVALSLVAATVGTGMASSTSELSECLGAANRVRVGAGGQGSDPNSLSAGEAAASERKSAQQRQARGITPNAMSFMSVTPRGVRLPRGTDRLMD